MRLTTKGRFAVTAMVDLATRGGKAPVTLASISERQSISLSYLEQLFGKLRRNKIVESVRGPGGGYYLARPGNKISIAEIVVAVDEPLDATKCGGMGNCHGEEHPCLTHDLWMGLNEKILDYLESVTLQQLVENHSNRSQGTSTVVLKKSIKPQATPV
ncbi:MAG: Fe-S cluster assembly transcription factor [Nitrosomonadales bacterium]|nr:Fe-S cluster assembly transcription factor [Nitrosomonadales bacterium]